MSIYGLHDETIFAKQEELANRRRSPRLEALLRRIEEPSRAPGAELSEEARRSIREFEEHVSALNELVDTEIESLVPPRLTSPDVASMQDSDHRLHVFGPDGAHPYAHGWTHLDSGQARVDVPNGTFWAYNYTTGPARFTVAQLGANLRPSVPVCRLSVRAYVRFSGYNILSHRVHQPGTTERKRAWALGSVGLKVDSWNLDGSAYNLDGERWVNVWDRGEDNPSGRRDFDDSVSVSDGMILEPLGIDSRNYIIWVTCRVGVSADPGFEVSTYATSSIACQVPYFVVEEIEHF